MASAPSSLYRAYQPTSTPSNGVSYQNTTDPTKAAQNQRQYVASQGDQLQTQDQDLANQFYQQQSGTQQFINPIEQQQASGQGGYSPDQVSQIELTPGQQQNIVTNAGISAGQSNAAAVGGAERAAAASGGNPLALATYRARAAQTEGVNAGNAETAARVAAQQAGSAGAQAVGNATLAQQNQGLSYLGNLQAQQGSEGQGEQGLQQGAYGTETGGTGQAVGQQIGASQLPTTTDKIIGGLSGAVSQLADGDPGDGGQDAVVGENGIEAVIENAPKAVQRAASDPIRNHTTFMDDGTAASGDPDAIMPFDANQAIAAAPSAQTSQPNFLARYLNQQKQQQNAPAQPQQWNTATPYQQGGGIVGSIAKALLLEDGEMLAGGKMGSGFHWSAPRPHMPHVPAGGYQPLNYRAKSMLADGQAGDGEVPNGTPVGDARVFNKPTMVHLDAGDSVVPLTYRAKAKVRPSAALPALNAGRSMRHAA